MTSVGPPEFETLVGDDADIPIPGLGSPHESPRPNSNGSSTPVAIIAGLALVSVLALVLLSRSSDAPPPDARGPTTTTTTTIPPEPDELFVAQSAEALYRRRPVEETSVFAASEAVTGFYGLGRLDGKWYPMRSLDGIDWNMDTSEEISGVPEGFRPGAPRWGRDIIRTIDGVYWSQFGSQQLAGAEWATLLLRSTDGVAWERAEVVPDELRPTPIERFYQLVPPSDLNDTIPDVTGSWLLVDAAESSHGYAALFYDRDRTNFRLAVSRDGEEWMTVGLEERGEVAVEIVVVGRDAVLLRAANVANRPTELIVPLPERAPTQPPYERAPVDPVVAMIAPTGNDYVGFLASRTNLGQIEIVRSPDGMNWSRGNAIPISGLPQFSDPVGLWGEEKFIGAFADSTGKTLRYASGLGADWEVELEFSGDNQLRPGVTVLGGNEVFFTIEERGPDSTSYRYFIAPRDLSSATEIDSSIGRITAAVWTDDGLVVNALGASGDPFDSVLVYWSEGQWQRYASEGLDPNLVLSLSRQGADVFALTLDRSKIYVPDGYRWATAGPGPFELITASETTVVEAIANEDGAAILLADQNADATEGIYTVLVSRDYFRWKSVHIAEDLITLTVKALGADEVIFEGVVAAAGPRRISVGLG